MVNDQIADFLTRLRNASRARITRLDAMNTKMNRRVADILQTEGFIKSHKDVVVEGKNFLRVYLKYEDQNLQKPVIQGIRRASRPGLRRYVDSKNLPRVMSGFGIAIISSSKGVITDKEARKLGVGGEHLCSVW